MNRAVIFDLDGTLIDSAPDIHAAASIVLERHGLAPFTLTQVRRFVGHGAAIFIERCLSARGLQGEDGLQEALLQEFLELYEGAVHLTQLYPGVVACLKALAKQNFTLAICTNKPEGPTHAVMAHLEISERFATVVGGDTLSVRKPDPAPLREVMARMETDKAVFVGDSEVDAETASKAGLPFALYTQGYRRMPIEALLHDARFDHFSDLPGIIESLMK